MVQSHANPYCRRKMVHLNPAKLTGYERNARTHSVEQVRQIRASIDAFGATNPILIDEGGGMIAGHGRRDAALLEPALAEFPCIVLEGLTSDQKRALVIADNKLALNAGWDLAILQAELLDLRGAGVDLALLGFSAEEAKATLAWKSGNGLIDADDAPAVESVAVSARDDVWHLGPHRLVCGDATLAADVARALDGAVPHLMVTDPPYGVNYDPAWRNRVGRSKTKRIGKVENDDIADWRGAWALFPGDVAYVWHGSLHGPIVATGLEEVGFAMRATIIWAKASLVMGRGHYHWQHEPCWYAVRNNGHWAGDRKQSTLWQIATKNQDAETTHGTQKPVPCMLRPMENSSRAGDHVYEPFSGSGTTLIAGEMSGRVVHALEINPLYVDVAVRRWEAFTGLAAVLSGDGRDFAVVAAQRCSGCGRRAAS